MTNIFEELSLYRSTNELDSKMLKINNRVSTISGDPFIVLVDLLKVLLGENGIEKGINSLLKSVNKVQSSFKETLKHEIRDVLGGDKNKKVFEGDLVLNIKKLSPNKKLITTDSKVISNFSEFDKKLNKAITSNTSVDLNQSLSVTYNYNNGDFTFKFKASNKPHIEILESLINEMAKIEITNLFFEVLDSMFNMTNKTTSELENEAKINIILNKLTTIEDIDDSYFKFDGDDVKLIEETIKIVKENYYGDPNTEGSLNIDDYNTLVSGKRNMLGASFLTALSEIVTKNVYLLDKNTAKKNFLERFISAFKNVLIKKYLLSSEIIIIYNTLYKSNDSGEEFMKKNKNFFKCIHKQLLNLLLVVLYEIVKKEIGKLMLSLTKTYTKEILNKYRNILSSLF